MLKAININSTVLVKITKYGRGIYYENYKRLTGEYPILKEDENGYSKWAFWDLMKEFGHYLTMGFKVPFEPVILIEETYKTDSQLSK